MLYEILIVWEYNYFAIFYPSATSNIIIIVKPNINPKVDRFLFSLIDSGSNSRAATVIIAPAAKASKNGKILFIVKTNITPITAEIGSTRADA